MTDVDEYGKLLRYLFAAEALLGELLVVAGTAENVSSFREEALRSYWPFTVEAGEAILMPRVAFVLHALCVFRSQEKDAYIKMGNFKVVLGVCVATNKIFNFYHPKTMV